MSELSPQEKSVPDEMSDVRFSDKVIVITGAGGNFGRTGCLYFALRGAKVAALDKNAESLQETVAFVAGEMNSGGCADVRAFECDVTDPSSVDSSLQSVIGAFGRIDLLWNNAGYQGQIKPTLEYDIKDFDSVMKINVTGMFTVLQAVAKHMVDVDDTPTPKTGEAKSGTWEVKPYKYAIVNTASVAGMRGTPGMVAYSSSKAAVLAMTVASAKDLAPHGIRVNAVSPALIGPGFMWERQNILHAKSGSPYFADDPEEVAKNKISGVPMKRLGTVDEVVKSVAFLLSDDSSYTTAFNMVVDGGLSGGLR